MRKKRRNKQDKTTGQKMLKTATATSATIAGVAFFRNTKAASRLASDVFPAVRKTYTNISKDLSEHRGKMTASRIEKAFDKHIGKDGDIFLRNLKNGRKKASQSIADFGEKNGLYSKDNGRSFMGHLIEMDRWKKENGKLIGMAKAEKRIQLKDQEIGYEIYNSFGGKYTKEQARQMTDALYDGIETATFKKNGQEFFYYGYKDKFLTDLGVESKDRETIFNIVSQQKKKIESEVNKVEVDEAAEKIDEILKRKETIKAHTDKYIYNRMDKFLKKFGLNVDTEQYFTGSKAIRLKDLTKEDIEELKKVTKTYEAAVKPKGATTNVKSVNLGSEIENLLNTDKDAYGDIILDRSLRRRVNKDGSVEIFSTDDFDQYLTEKRKSFSSSIIGKILYAGIDFENQINKPFATMLHSGKISSMADDTLLDKAYLYMNGKAYKFYEGSEGYTLDEGFDIGLISSKHGKSARILRGTMGTTRINPNNTNDELLEKLDIGQNGKSNIFRNVLNNIFGDPDEINERRVGYRLRYTLKNYHYINNGTVNNVYDSDLALYDDMSIMRKMLDYNISKNGVDNATFAQLRDSLAENSGLRTIMNAASNDDLTIEEIFDVIKENEAVLSGKNKISDLLNIYKKDPSKIYSYLTIDASPEHTLPIVDMPIAVTNVRGARQAVRNALIEEYLSENSYLKKSNFYDALKGLDITERQRDALDSISLNIVLRDTMASFESREAISESDEFYESLKNLALNSDKVNSIISNVEKDFTIFNKGSISANSAYFSDDEYNAYDLIRKSALPETIANAFDMFTNPNSRITGQDLIEGINNTIKELTTGGKNDKEHFTMLTMLSQYSMQRLSMGVEEVGLGLSHKSMASPVDTFKNIALKRVLPAMAVFNALDYLNFESRNITGVSLVGAAANVTSNTDLAFRNVLDHTGLGYLYGGFKNSSVIAEYLTGTTDYQDRDEREEWYRSGESVVRKARFWSFGSSSEFRGTSISYYQPNYLRRAHSNYKEVSIYGDLDEKWKHSPLPSLRHPLSPIRFLLDPYWLEKKNFDERPYPLTGKMFSEGTPWGAILNPTVGQMIKPVRMLPQARKRLEHGRVGEDINNVLYRINERIKNKESSDDDMLIVSGTDIRNAEYVPFGHPIGEEYNLTNNTIRGLDYMDSVSDITTYEAPEGEVYTQNSGFGKSTGISLYSSRREQKAEAFANEIFKGTEVVSAGQQLIRNINNTIKGRDVYSRYQTNMPDDGVYIYKNLVRDKKKADAQYYENKLNPYRVDRSIGRDLMRDAGYSVKQLSGIYGFIGDTVFGSDYKTFRFENAGQMTSFSRGFWDSSVGGLGGGLMEISRRFFPSTNKDIVNVNPLRNNMAAWLPDSYRMGDPFVKIPKGEMRLPGRGYETLHELHPDQFATDGYGAFDRFKILADVAPYSDEYKTWHGIAKRTIKDPELVAQMEEIEKRVKKKSGDHEFFEYRYINNNTKIEEGVVKSVSESGTIELQNGLVLDLAGLKPSKNKEEQVQSIYDFIKPGDRINYKTTENAIKNLDDMTEITKAIIYKRDAAMFSARNVSKELIDAGIMEYDEEDTSAIAPLAKTGAIGEGLGAIQEVIAHAPIPFLHNKFLKVETALESFKSEKVYGSSFQTWDHPIEGFVKPALNRSFSQSMSQKALALGVSYYHFKYAAQTRGALKYASGLALSTLEPTAFLFGAANWAYRLNDGSYSISGLKTGNEGLGAFSRGAKVGSVVGAVGWGIANAKNPITAATSFGLAALGASEILEDTTEVLQRRLPKKILDNKLFKGEVTPFKIAAAGAMVGLGVSAVRNETSHGEEMFGKWIPKGTRKRYELDEYFDRLSYIKYEGLYNKAARLASLREGSNIGYVFKQLDKNKKKVGKLKKKALELSNKHMVGSYEYEEKMNEIRTQIASLEEQQRIAFKAGGKYTKAAIAYKKAAESTIYGLNEGSSRDEIMAAVPNQYKDHFMAFMNETDEKKRKEILSYMPKYLRKPLQVAWGQDYEVRSNARYFMKKRLPNMAWKGWKPNVNMDHVKMKTIESEGMLLSDFGYYESEKSKAQYERADAVKPTDRGIPLGMGAKLITTMQGLGMPLTNVTVEETSRPGITILGDFQQQAQDVVSLASYI